MVREILKIRTDNGLGNNNPTFKGIELTEYNAKFPRMGMPSLSATLMWPTCLDEEWTQTEYVVLKDEIFYIRHTPSSSRNNTDSRYKHEIEFTSEFAEILGNTYFIDAVPDLRSGIECITANKPCSNNTTFTFYGTIFEFVDRLNCAFHYAGIGDSILLSKTNLTTEDEVTGDGYCAMVDQFGDYDPDKSYEFSFSDKKFWEVITEGYNITGIPFERRARKIIFGRTPDVIEHKFEYGHDNELLSVSKKNANAQVINRTTMVGSSENIPYYYPNETEYGHISIAEKNTNKVLTSGMIEIASMTTLLSRLNADSFAVLGKYNSGVIVHAASSPNISQTSAYMYSSCFDNDIFASYNLSQYLQHNAVSDSMFSLWHIRVFFNVAEDGIIECSNIRGNVWLRNDTPPEEDVDLFNDVTPEILSSVDDGLQVDYTSQIEKGSNTISFGTLKNGKYFFQFYIKVPNRDRHNRLSDALCYLSKVSILAEVRQKTGYYWEVGDKKYDSAAKLGVRISGPITDAMIGDGFGWIASGRMPFQDHLVPPKYRNTLGAERFYNALNNTYTDPDTGNSYVFPNPFKAGAPSEYIYRNEEIKPTIEGVKNAAGELFGVIADVAYDADDNDALKPDSEEGDKNDSLKYEHSFFYIKLNIFDGEYGFDLFANAIQTDAMTIQMRSGNCNGCKFKIQAAKFTDADGFETYKNPVIVKDGVAVGVVSEEGIKESDIDPTQQNTQTHSIWICVQKDAETFGVIMPNHSNNFKPAIGDTFNITNIELPQGYILAAEKRLEDEGIRFMADNNEEQFTFDIQASRIFLAEHPDVLEEIDEYSVIKVKYNGREYEQYVNQLTIDCKDNEALPNIGIDLTDTLSVGQSFVEKVAERAASLIANAVYLGCGAGGGLSAALAERRYLNKQKADRTPYPLKVGGRFTAEAGAHFGNFVQGQFTGRGGAIDAAGNAEVESITVRSSMKVMELIYNRLNAQEGNTSFADSGTIDCIFANPDGTLSAQIRRRWDGDFTSFQPGDVIYGYVNNLNKSSGREYYKAWSWIKSVNRTANQIVIVSYPDAETPAGANHPMAEGMIVTRWGNNIEPTVQTYVNPEYSAVIGKRADGTYYNKRQRSFFISCEDGNIVELMGVNKPILEAANYGTILGVIPDGLLDENTEELINKEQPYLFARGVIVQDLIRIGYEGLTTRIANYRGLWNAETAASPTDYYRSTKGMYDTVTWNGSLWQCVVSMSTDEPSDSSATWVKMTAGPEDGEELRMWTINPNTNIVSVRQNEVIPAILSATVTLNSSKNAPVEFTSNLDLYDAGAQLYFSVDGEIWKVFTIGIVEPLDLEDETGVIELEDSVDDSHVLTVGGDDIDTNTIADRIYFELRSVENGAVLAKTDVPVVKDGKDGEAAAAGRDGLMVYPAGIYDSSVTYSATGDTMPVVMYKGNYYRLRAGVEYTGDNETAVIESNRNPAYVWENEPADTARWILFDKFDSVFANIVMAEFAKLAQAVFYGNWMISQKGFLNGAPSGQYQHFKDQNSPFEPNFAVNFLTGEMSAITGVFSGLVKKRPTVITPDNLSTYLSQNSDEDAMVVNWDKCGTFLQFEGNIASVAMGSSIILDLPSIDANVSYSDAKLNELRQYIGTTIVIYNYSNVNIGIWGPIERSTNNRVSPTTVILASGECISMTCTLTQRAQTGTSYDTDEEQTAWIYRSKAKIKNFNAQ